MGCYFLPPSRESLTVGAGVSADFVGISSLILRATLHKKVHTLPLRGRSTGYEFFDTAGVARAWHRRRLSETGTLPASIPVSTYSICSHLHERLTLGQKLNVTLIRD